MDHARALRSSTQSITGSGYEIGALVVCLPHTRIFLPRMTKDMNVFDIKQIFGLHIINDENAANVARTQGNVVDPTCHE